MLHVIQRHLLMLLVLPLHRTSSIQPPSKQLPLLAQETSLRQRTPLLLELRLLLLLLQRMWKSIQMQLQWLLQFSTGCPRLLSAAYRLARVRCLLLSTLSLTVEMLLLLQRQILLLLHSRTLLQQQQLLLTKVLLPPSPLQMAAALLEFRRGRTH